MCIVAGVATHRTLPAPMVDEQRPGYRGQLSAGAPTLAEILKTHGYETVIVGKWHLTLTKESENQTQLFPLDRGFDFFHGTWWGPRTIPVPNT